MNDFVLAIITFLSPGLAALASLPIIDYLEKRNIL